MAPVVVIQDVVWIRTMLEECLSLEGYGVLPANGGQEGLRLLQRLPCRAVVVLDVSMPPPNGRDLLLALNAAPAWRARYVVILYDAQHWLEWVSDLGADMSVEMAQGLDHLLEAVQRGQRMLASRPGDRRFDNLKFIHLL